MTKYNETLHKQEGSACELGIGGKKMISEESQQRINNLRKQIYKVKTAVLKQKMGEHLGNQLIDELMLRINKLASGY